MQMRLMGFSHGLLSRPLLSLHHCVDFTLVCVCICAYLCPSAYRCLWLFFVFLDSLAPDTHFLSGAHIVSLHVLILSALHFFVRPLISPLVMFVSYLLMCYPHPPFSSHTHTVTAMVVAWITMMEGNLWNEKTCFHWWYGTVWYGEQKLCL